MVHAGADVDWNTVMHATFGAHFGVPVEEFQLALVGGVVEAGAGGAEVVVGDDLQDVTGAEFANSAVAVEWVIVRLEVFDSAHSVRTTRRRRIVGRGMTRRFRFGAGIGGSYCLDTHRDGAEVEVVEVWVGSIIPFNFIHIIGQELKRGGSLNVIRVLSAQCHELILE